jgi:hypothetical protein
MAYTLQKMKSHLLLLLLLSSLALWASDGAKPPKSYGGRGHPTIDFEKPDLADSDGKAAWRMWYIFRGTRSEGLHGVILEDRKLIEGGKTGDTKSVNGKEYVWCGTWDSRKHLYSLSGWLPKSDDRVRRWLANTKKTEPAGTGQPATRIESESEGGDKPQPEAEDRSR